MEEEPEAVVVSHFQGALASILRSGYCLCGVSQVLPDLHVFPLGFFLLAKNIPIGGLVALRFPKCE